MTRYVKARKASHHVKSHHSSQVQRDAFFNERPDTFMPFTQGCLIRPPVWRPGQVLHLNEEVVVIHSWLARCVMFFVRGMPSSKQGRGMIMRARR